MSRRAGQHVTAVLLAAGSGQRAGGAVPKQFLDLAGRPMLVHSLLAFEASERVTSVVVVLPEERPLAVEQAVALPKVWSVASGGPTRQASLAEGLACLPEQAAVVLVHDAARPLVSAGLVERVLEGVGGVYEGAIAAVPVDDAVKEVSAGGEILQARPRTGQWRAQTPQAFLRECLEDSLARADAEGVVCEDCSEMATRAGYRVRVVMGDPFNLKATRPRDLWLCERILAARVAAGVLERSPG